jgi:hypothetical protein
LSPRRRGAGIKRHNECLLTLGEKVRMRGSFCATLTLALSLEGEGMSRLIHWKNRARRRPGGNRKGD